MYAFAETVTLTDEQAATAIAGGLLGFSDSYFIS